jgi:hypothetical protein
MQIIRPKKDPLKLTTGNITPHQQGQKPAVGANFTEKRQPPPGIVVPKLLAASNTPERGMRTAPKPTVKEKQDIVSSMSDLMYSAMKSEPEKARGNIRNIVFPKHGLGDSGAPTRSIHGGKRSQAMVAQAQAAAFGEKRASTQTHLAKAGESHERRTDDPGYDSSRSALLSLLHSLQSCIGTLQAPCQQTHELSCFQQQIPPLIFTPNARSSCSHAFLLVL